MIDSKPCAQILAIKPETSGSVTFNLSIGIKFPLKYQQLLGLILDLSRSRNSTSSLDEIISNDQAVVKHPLIQSRLGY